MPVNATDAIISGLIRAYGGSSRDHRHSALFVRDAIEQCGLRIVTAEPSTAMRRAAVCNGDPDDYEAEIYRSMVAAGSAAHD